VPGRAPLSLGGTYQPVQESYLWNTFFFEQDGELMPDPATRLENKVWPKALRVLLPFLALALPFPVSGQLPDSLRISRDSLLVAAEGLQETVESPIEEPQGITPRGAFIRSGIIPGWGHSMVGAHGRGAFYFLVESITAFMLVKTRGQLDLARDKRVLWESVAIARLQADGIDIQDPLDLEPIIGDNPEYEELWFHVDDVRGLEETRSGQQEDWMALGIFFLFIGGADAYVSAHLADFPGAVEIDPTPTGGMEVGFSFPVNF
jgi:hypothetical protein